MGAGRPSPEGHWEANPPFLSLWSPCSYHSQSPHLSLSTPGPHWSSLSFQSQYLVENWASLLCYLIPNSGAFPVLLGIEWVRGKDTHTPHTRAHPCTRVPWKHEFTRVSRSFQAWLLRVCGPNVFTFSWWLLLLFWLAETDRFKNFEMIFFLKVNLQVQNLWLFYCSWHFIGQPVLAPG